MTHDELVKCARIWLSKTCPIVVTEIVTQVMEQPDVLGWDGKGWTTIIECKTSVEDFRRDEKKPFRAPNSWAMGLGSFRYYMAPDAIITTDMLPFGWGLLSISGGKVKMVRRAKIQDANFGAELLVLMSVIKRIGKGAPRGISIKCYAHQTRCRATVSIDPNAEDELPTILSISDSDSRISPASRLSALEERVGRVNKLIDELTRAKQCPYCTNVGWYVGGNPENPEQVQCEWCETIPDSLFHAIENLKAFLHDGTKGEGK